jgi:hypothetical protein
LDEEELDYVEPKSKQDEGMSDDEPKNHFKTYKLDVSVVSPEFMCPIQQSKPVHFLSVPMLARCCGYSACYDCLKLCLAD